MYGGIRVHDKPSDIDTGLRLGTFINRRVTTVISENDKGENLPSVRLKDKGKPEENVRRG